MQHCKSNKTRNKALSVFLIPVAFLFLFFGCTKNKWIIEDQREEILNGNERYVVYFNPRLESNFTKALTPFPQNCYVQVYASNTMSLNSLFFPFLYESLSPGTLSPVSKPISISPGIYNFYAVSTKNDSIPPSFNTQNFATTLYNGIDYLWSGVMDKNVWESGEVIDITFTHCATQLVFNIVNNSQANAIDSVIYAAMGVPTIDSVSWNLVTGEIPQLQTDPSDIQIMNYSKNTLSGICLPFISSKPIILACYALTAQNELFTFNVDVPPLSNGYLGGHSYQYNLVFDQDTLMVGDVLVAPWIEHNQGTIIVK
ncbi:MAG: fimbrillin family protein [Marinifilaceae bacterium]